MASLSFLRWLKPRSKSSVRTTKDQRPLRQPALEKLEDRVLPGMMLELSGLLTAFALPTGSGLPLQLGAPTSPVKPATPLTSSPQQTVTVTTAPIQIIYTSPAPAATSLPTTPAAPTGTGNPAVIPVAITGPTQSPAPTTTGPTGGLTMPFAPTSPSGSGNRMMLVTAMSEDTGKAGDALTADTSLTLSGRGTPGLTFTAYEGSKNLGSGTMADDGTFSVALTGALDDGKHVVSLRDNAQTVLTAFAFDVDTTPPIVTLSGPEFTNDVTPVVNIDLPKVDNYGNNSAVTIDFDANQDGDFKDEGEAGYATVQTSLGRGTLSFTQPLEEGTYRIRAHATDLAGNAGTSTFTMRIDPNAGYVRSPELLQLYRQHSEQIGGNGGLTAMPNWGTIIGSEYVDMLPGSGIGPQSNEAALTSRTAAGLKNLYAQAMLGSPDLDTLVIDNQDRVLVNARVTMTKYLNDFKADLKELGMTVTNTTGDGIVAGWLPIGKIGAVVGVEHFSTLTPVYRAMTNVGLAENQGDAIIGGPSFRSGQRVDGSGVKVGVLSDTVSRVGGGLADSQATGDLPANVEVLQDGPIVGASDEGRAMLEIIHDVAPGASLAFATAFLGAGSFANNIRDLADAGSNVIVDDVTYFNSPRFNDGRISQAVEDVTTAGVFYATSAGNVADDGYLANWRSSGTTTIGSGAATVTGTFHNFGGGDILQNFTLADGATIDVSFQWDAAFLEGGSSQANFQVRNDVDIYLTDAAGTAIVDASILPNTFTDEAFERIVFTNTSGAAADLAFAFHLDIGPAPTRIAWRKNRLDDPNAEFEGAPTTWGHANAKGVVTVGAVSAFAPDVRESFSSRGGNLDILFDRAGNRLGEAEIRTRPQVAAPDGVNTSFFGNDVPNDADVLPNFFGTSAAAPQVAAAAALILQQARFDISVDELTQHFIDTAIDVDAPGFDDYTGAGRIDLQPFLRNADVAGIEPNETSAEAAYLGALGAGDSVMRLSIKTKEDGLPDYDWFRWAAASSGTFRLGINVKAGAGVLEFSLWTLEGRALKELASTTAGARESTSLEAQVSANQQIYVQIKGQETSLGVMAQGNYDLTAQIF